MSNTIVAHPIAASTAAPVTHEAFIHAVRAIVLPRVGDDTQRVRLAESKLVYGAGHGMGARGSRSTERGRTALPVTISSKSALLAKRPPCRSRSRGESQQSTGSLIGGEPQP